MSVSRVPRIRGQEIDVEVLRSLRAAEAARLRGIPMRQNPLIVGMTEMRTYLTMSELTGRPTPTSYLVKHVALLDWRRALTLLSRVAAVLANDGGATGEAIQRVTLEALAAYPATSATERALVARIRAYQPRRGRHPIIAHDQVVFFLQAMVLLHGNETGRTPSLAELAFLMICANDHLDENISRGSARPKPSTEDLATVLCQVRKFNKERDIACAFARAALMFEQPPDDKLLPGDPTWLEFQRVAFDGRTFAEHFDLFLGPLVFASKLWGGLSDADAKDPLIPRRTWLSNTGVAAEDGERFLNSLGLERDACVRQIPVRDDGLPSRPAIFFRAPLVHLVADTSVCLSPRFIQDQMYLGLWARFREAANRTSNTSRWLRQFGMIVEIWARRVGRAAAAADGRLNGQLIVSQHVGSDDEIEDVVLADQRNTVLFSVKGALLPARVLDASTAETIAWYERFLFEPPDPKLERDHRGAVRKLDDKVQLIRAGRWGQVARDSYVIPVIVTFESLHENPALYAWIQRRCDELGLLRDGRTAPLCLATIDDFEYLMAMGARGQDLVQVMRNKPVSTWRTRNLDAMLYELAGHESPLRLDFIQDGYDRVSSRMIKRLFGERGEQALRSEVGRDANDTTP